VFILIQFKDSMPPDNLPPRWKKLAYMDKLIQRFGPTLLSISREQALERVEKIETTRLQLVALNRGVSFQELKRREGWGNMTFVMTGNRMPTPQGNPFNHGYGFQGGHRGRGYGRPRFDYGSGNYRGQQPGFRGGGNSQGYGNFRPPNPRAPHRDPRDQASSSQQGDNRNNQHHSPAKKSRGNFSPFKGGRGRGGQNPQGF
jgi:hypothetical protein